MVKHNGGRQNYQNDLTDGLNGLYFRLIRNPPRKSRISKLMKKQKRGNLLISTFNMVILYFGAMFYCWTHIFLWIGKIPVTWIVHTWIYTTYNEIINKIVPFKFTEINGLRKGGRCLGLHCQVFKLISVCWLKGACVNWCHCLQNTVYCIMELIQMLHKHMQNSKFITRSNSKLAVYIDNDSHKTRPLKNNTDV